jgi:hypothetical protein
VETFLCFKYLQQLLGYPFLKSAIKALIQTHHSLESSFLFVFVGSSVVLANLDGRAGRTAISVVVHHDHRFHRCAQVLPT